MLPSLTPILTAVAALAAVLGVILLTGRVLQRGRSTRTTARRLAASEVLALDAGRRLHLVRCDGREVLLLIGGGRDIVVGWLPAGDKTAGRRPVGDAAP